MTIFERGSRVDGRFRSEIKNPQSAIVNQPSSDMFPLDSLPPPPFPLPKAR